MFIYFLFPPNSGFICVRQLYMSCYLKSNNAIIWLTGLIIIIICIIIIIIIIIFVSCYYYYYFIITIISLHDRTLRPLNA